MATLIRAEMYVDAQDIDMLFDDYVGREQLVSMAYRAPVFAWASIQGLAHAIFPEEEA